RGRSYGPQVEEAAVRDVDVAALPRQDRDRPARAKLPRDLELEATPAKMRLVGAPRVGTPDRLHRPVVRRARGGAELHGKRMADREFSIGRVFLRIQRIDLAVLIAAEADLAANVVAALRRNEFQRLSRGHVPDERRSRREVIPRIERVLEGAERKGRERLDVEERAPAKASPR